MTTTVDTKWGNYMVIVRPSHWLQKHVRYHHWYMPFMDGDRVYLELTIKTNTKTSVKKPVRCSWLFRKQADGQQFGSGEYYLTTVTEKRVQISSDLLLQPDKYVLEIQLIEDGATEVEKPAVAAILSVKERGEVTLQYAIPLILSICTLVLSVVLSIAASIIVERL
jgi:hypothetical protein